MIRDFGGSFLVISTDAQGGPLPVINGVIIYCIAYNPSEWVIGAINSIRGVIGVLTPFIPSMDPSCTTSVRMLPRPRLFLPVF